MQKHAKTQTVAYTAHRHTQTVARDLTSSFDCHCFSFITRFKGAGRGFCLLLLLLFALVYFCGRVEQTVEYDLVVMMKDAVYCVLLLVLLIVRLRDHYYYYAMQQL